MEIEEISKIDGKGRVLIPSKIRKSANLADDSAIIVSYDSDSNSVRIIPAFEKRLDRIEIGMGDVPGALSRLASALYIEGVDIVKSESVSMSRGKKARWLVTCKGMEHGQAERVKKRLLKSGAESVLVSKL
ncbi:MAG: hypothetical protein WC506_04800 [Candidatus Micrarchaeia archaeon]